MTNPKIKMYRKGKINAPANLSDDEITAFKNALDKILTFKVMIMLFCLYAGWIGLKANLESDSISIMSTLLCITGFLLGVIVGIQAFLLAINIKRKNIKYRYGVIDKKVKRLASGIITPNIMCNGAFYKAVDKPTRDAEENTTIKLAVMPLNDNIALQYAMK